jgi:DNA-directed RNA polymerase specialized sigma24 family protein
MEPAPTQGGTGSQRRPNADQLDPLLAIARQRRALDTAERELLKRARQEGWTLAEIGRVLGVSRQAVHQRLQRAHRGRLAVGALLNSNALIDAVGSLLT